MWFPDAWIEAVASTLGLYITYVHAGLGSCRDVKGASADGHFLFPAAEGGTEQQIQADEAH